MLRGNGAPAKNWGVRAPANPSYFTHMLTGTYPCSINATIIVAKYFTQEVYFSFTSLEHSTNLVLVHLISEFFQHVM